MNHNDPMIKFVDEACDLARKNELRADNAEILARAAEARAKHWAGECDKLLAAVAKLPNECDACSAKSGSPVLCELCLGARTLRGVAGRISVSAPSAAKPPPDEECPHGGTCITAAICAARTARMREPRRP